MKTIYGNMQISAEDSVVRLRMLTAIAGNPGCLFTYNEIPKLIELLKQAQREGDKPKETELSEDDLFGDL